MGQYEPNDSRDVTLRQGDEPGGIERTGPREGETRQREQGEGARPGDQQQATHSEAGAPRPEYDQYEVNQPGSIDKQSEAQMGYGNARDADDRMEQDRRRAAQPGETADDPATRARADAQRPLGGE